MTLDELNSLPSDAAVRELEHCCGSARWTAGMVARRPFRDASSLYKAADDVWARLDGTDWLEAFAHHPRIGERAAGWAKGEQAGVHGASDETMRELAELNEAYEKKFAHVFLICATGKSAAEMLRELQRRMSNDANTELRVAAAEQAKITRLRLEKLLSGLRSPSAAGGPG